MEHSHPAGSSHHAGEVSEESSSPKDRKGSPKSASARFRSFIGRDKEHSATTSTGSMSSSGASASGGDTSPNSSRRPHSISSPNLVSLLNVRDNRPVAPSKSPQFGRKEPHAASQEHPPVSRITPAKNLKNVPIYMYLDDECEFSSPEPSSSSTPPSYTPLVPSPTASPHSSPKPTRPSPLPPRRRPESDEIEVLVHTIATPEMHAASHNPIVDSHKLTHPPAAPTDAHKPAPTDAHKPPTSPRKPPTDAMLHSILASPLMGTAAPAFSSEIEPLDLGFTSPTVLRRPPPKGFGGGGSTTMDNLLSPSKLQSSQTQSLSPRNPISPRDAISPRNPLSPRVPLFVSRELNGAGKDLVDLAESTFTPDSSNLTKLFLARNHLKTLPSSISHLTDLTHMDLSYNKFENLPNLEHMVKLKELYLQGNFLLQSDSSLAGLSSLGNLKKLDLSSNEIGKSNSTIPTDVHYLTSLQELLIPHNDIISLSPDLAWLSNLTIADLSHNALSVLPPEIGTLQNLKKLNLRRNKLASVPDELSSLTNLIELDLSYNELTHLPTSYASLYNLITLHLSYNNLTEIPPELFGGGDPIESEDGQMWVQGMFALKELRVRQNNLTSISETISNLVDLQLLELTCNKITEVPFSSLAAVTKLENLMLAGNRLHEISDDICSFQSLDALNVSDNLITTLPENLWQLSTLRNLSISHNQISSIPLPPPGETWRSLEELFAAGNPNLKEISAFGELPSLRDLYLQNCAFTAVPLLHSAANMPSLEKLDLSHNFISSLDPDFFLMENLSRLAISHNHFTNLPVEISHLRRVEYLDFSHNKITQEPEFVKIMKLSVGTEIITTGNPYTLTQPKPDHANGESSIFHISMSDLVGRRPTMEDTFSVCPKLGGVEGREAFAIFDGHAGSIASHFVAKYLEQIINSIISAHPTEHPLKWLSLTYAKLTELFQKKIHDSKVSGSKHCGTTGLILLVDSGHYYIANVGDTRAVLSRGGKAIRLSTDDKPSNPEEELRIRKLGGFVVVGSEISRVNGTLAVSRSIGDFYMHPYVTAEPHLHEFTREPSDKFIILACDGVWDEISDQHSVDIVAGHKDLTRAAFSLRDKAYAYGSDDNISVMLLKLK